MPNYSRNDPKGWCGDPSRGAALGRPTVKEESKDYSGRLCLRYMRLDSGGYDKNGTYFGHGQRLYWCATKDSIPAYRDMRGTVRGFDGPYVIVLWDCDVLGTAKNSPTSRHLPEHLKLVKHGKDSAQLREVSTKHDEEVPAPEKPGTGSA